MAFSTDGLHFTAKMDPLGPAYFRVFQWGESTMQSPAQAGFRARGIGVTPFEQGPTLFEQDQNLILRHAVVDLQGNQLSVYYSRIGDRPERILLSRISLRPD